MKKTADGFTYLDAKQFHEYFAADLPESEAAFMAHRRCLTWPKFQRCDYDSGVENEAELDAGGNFRQNDQSRPRTLVRRGAKSHKIEVAGASHSVYVSRPKEVAAAIEEAAATARRN